MSSDYYIAMLEPLKGEIEKKRPPLKKIKVIFVELGYGLLPYPTCSPDPTPSDISLFSNLKRIFARKKFRNNKEKIVKIEA